MREKSIAKVWARALLETASEKGQLPEAVAGAQALQELLARVPLLQAFLASPRIPEAEKKQKLRGALAGALPGVWMNFLGLLVDRLRAMFLPEILEAFLDLWREAEGVAVARVRSAVALPAGLQDRLKAQLSTMFGVKIDLDAQVEPALLGGLVVQVGDTRFDRSLSRALREVGERMRGTRLDSEVLYADPNR